MIGLGIFEEEKIIIHEIVPIIEHKIRGLCSKPYYNHPKGCPQFGKGDRCPPNVLLFDKIFNMSIPMYAIINEFNLGAHVKKMKKKHPDWSDRQLYCVLYWQNTARKQLREKIEIAFHYSFMKDYKSTWCPEGMGVNVTKTMKNINVILEWPPVNIARQIAFLGYPL